MKSILRTLVVGAAVAACVIVYLRSLPPQLVAIGTPVRQDDFLYTVTRVEKMRARGGIDYAVTIKIDNQAKRVDYQWSDDSAFVTDSKGRRYNAAGAPGASNLYRAPIPAGASAEVNR